MTRKFAAKHHPKFEAVRQVSRDGNEFWSARDLAPLLEYQDWRNFMQVMDRARVACAQSGRRPDYHFVDTTKMVTIGSGAQHKVEDVPKPPTALGQRYPTGPIVARGSAGISSAPH